MLKKFILILIFFFRKTVFHNICHFPFYPPPPPKPKYAHPKQLCKQNKARELQFETYLVAVLKELIGVLTSTIITTIEKNAQVLRETVFVFPTRAKRRDTSQLENGNYVGFFCKSL